MKTQNSNSQTAARISHDLTGNKKNLQSSILPFSNTEIDLNDIFNVGKRFIEHTESDTTLCGFKSHLVGSETINIPEIFSGVHGFAGKTVINGKKLSSLHCICGGCLQIEREPCKIFTTVLFSD